MKVLVCVKQIPDPETPIEVDGRQGWFRPKRSDAYRMNRFDEFAVEEALQIRSRFPDVRVGAVSVGPMRVVMTLKRAMGMGVDHAVHLRTADTGYLSPWTVARSIARYGEESGYGLILTGVMAEDGMEGQVGPILAELLGMPCATSVMLQELNLEAGTIYVEREIEGGYRHALELTLPALLTIQAGINRPRYPSLSNVLRSKEQAVATIDVHSLRLPEPGEQVEQVSFPQRSRECTVLEGTPEEKAHRLARILREKSFL
jgi:electron transfer flavoprotein beta subunit